MYSVVILCTTVEWSLTSSLSSTTPTLARYVSPRRSLRVANNMPLMDNFRLSAIVATFCLDPTNINLFAISQSFRRWMSLFISFWSVEMPQVPVYVMLESSAYILVVANSAIVDKSLMKMRNKRGPKNDPCGTPHFIASLSDKTPLTYRHTEICPKGRT